MNLSKVCCMLMALGVFLTGCTERQPEEQENIYSTVQPDQIEGLNDIYGSDGINDQDAVGDKDTEKINIAYYVEQIEEAVNYEKFFYSQPIPGVYDIRNTDIYLNKNTGGFFFVPEGMEVERFFYCTTLNHHFERPVIEWHEHIDDDVQLEWIGNTEINYGMEATYNLPELSEEDLAVLEKVCDYLYDELSYVLDEFTYDVYLGDIVRGYDEEKKYIMVHVAIIGERRYHRCIDFTKEEDGYDFWMYPSLQNVPINTELAGEDEGDDNIINNIVFLNYLVRRLEK